MKKNLLFVFVLMLMTGFSLSAQNFNRCASTEYLAAQKLADPGLEARMAAIESQTERWVADHSNQKTAAVITVPVVFHIVYNTSSQNISDARIIEQLHVLNMDFSRTNANAGSTPSVWQGTAANTQVQFCFAQRDPGGNATNGIVRKSTTVTSFSTNDNVKHNSTGGDDAWPAGSYLNIWVCNLGSSLLGYATPPGGSASNDGVVVLYSSVGGPAAPGTLSPYHLGRTATHEVGHWLNLRHINGDSNCGSDLVSDTPTQDQLHFGCPNHPYHVNVCSGSGNGEMFMNYMDYTDDACMNMFTAGQGSRMQAALNGTRSSILSSSGCIPPAGGCGVPLSLNATNVTSNSATLNWSAVTNATSYNVRYRQTGTTTWTNTTSTTTSKAISGLLAAIQYEFQVQAVCNTGAGSFSSSANFTTTPPPCSDNYEPNNTSATAVAVTSNSTTAALISPPGDIDFFKFNNSINKPNIRITLTNLPADYDLTLIKSGTLATSAHGGTTSETIIWNTTVVGNYKVKVKGSGTANSPAQCYTLTVQISATPFRTEGGVTDADAVDALIVYPNPAADLLNVKFSSLQEGSVQIKIIDMIGKTAFSSVQKCVAGNNVYELNLSDLNKGIYFIQVNNGSNTEIKKIVVSK